MGLCTRTKPVLTKQLGEHGCRGLVQRSTAGEAEDLATRAARAARVCDAPGASAGTCRRGRHVMLVVEASRSNSFAGSGSLVSLAASSDTSYLIVLLRAQAVRGANAARCASSAASCRPLSATSS